MATLWGPREPVLERDENGHRTYSIDWLINASVSEGPQAISFCPGIPQIGDPWTYNGDYDLWAYCTPAWKIRPVLTDEPGCWWILSQKFTTYPITRCMDFPIEEPLLEPWKVNGRFNREQEEARLDKNGLPILSSSFEQMRGITKDVSKPTVSVSGNVATLDLALITSRIHTVNDSFLWGLEAGKIKFSDFSWQENFCQICYKYYTISYEFEIDWNGWNSREFVDMGSKELWHPDADPTDARNFVHKQDGQGELEVFPLKDYRKWRGFVLDGYPDTIVPELYEESNFLDLNIPISL